MLHYRERLPLVDFTFVCFACSTEFQANAPTMYCPRHDGEPIGEMSGS